jgi:Domain of unknown function (DUF4340)
MKIKSSTLAMLAIATLTVGGVYFWDRNQTQQTKTAEEKKTGTVLFQFKEADITQLNIRTNGQTVELARAGNGWQIKAPKPGPADDATVSFLLNLLVTGKSERSLEANPSELKEFGLEEPIATLDIQLKDQKAHQLLLGGQNFNQSARYARVDPFATKPGQKPAVMLIPSNFLDALNRPLSDWQAKPKSTQTPSISPSPQKN